MFCVATYVISIYPVEDSFAEIYTVNFNEGEFMDTQKIISDLEKTRKILSIKKRNMRITKILYRITTLLVIAYSIGWFVVYVKEVIKDSTMASYNINEKMVSFYGVAIVLGLVWTIFFILDYANVKNFSGDIKEFNDTYKNIFVVSVLTEYFDECKFDMDKGFDDETIKGFNIVQNGNNIQSEDYLSGRYRGIYFEQAEVSVKKRIRQGWKLMYMGWLTYLFSLKRNKISSRAINKKTKVGDTKDNMRTFFSGQMLTFSFPKENIKPLYVYSKNYDYRSEVYTDKLKTVNMENVGFNNDFDVLAAAEHDAFYVLTPHMQERIKIFIDKFESIAIRVDGNKMYLGLNNTNDMFDADIDRELTYDNERNKVYGDMQVIKDIIDIMLMQTQNS